MKIPTPNRKQGGFTHVLFIVFLVVAAGIGSIAYVVYNNQQVDSGDTGSEQVVSQTGVSSEVPGVVEIKEETDVDQNLQTLDKIDPVVDNEADVEELDELSNGL